MSQKSSLPQAAKSVSRVLMSDTGLWTNAFENHAGPPRSKNGLGRAGRAGGLTKSQSAVPNDGQRRSPHGQWNLCLHHALLKCDASEHAIPMRYCRGGIRIAPPN
jgi:hypothetical protein